VGIKCPLEYLQVYSTTLVSLLFITMIPIDCKITNFLILVCLLFLRDHHNYFLACAQSIISGKSVSQYASYSLIFSPLHSIMSREWHEKHLYNQFGHYRKYRMLDCQSTCLSYWYKSGYVALTRCITTLRFTSSFSNVWLIFLAKNNVRSTSASTELA